MTEHLIQGLTVVENCTSSRRCFFCILAYLNYLFIFLKRDILSNSHHCRRKRLTAFVKCSLLLDLLRICTGCVIFLPRQNAISAFKNFTISVKEHVEVELSLGKSANWHVFVANATLAFFPMGILNISLASRPNK